MKNDQEFLDVMWTKINLMEDEIIEKEEVRLRKKNALVLNLIISSVLIILSVTMFLFKFYIDWTPTYLIAFLVIGAAYMIEESSYIELMN